MIFVKETKFLITTMYKLDQKFFIIIFRYFY